MHHSGVYRGRNCSLPLYPPSVCKPSGDSIQQPSDCEAPSFTDRILPTDCLLLTAVTSRQCRTCLLQLCQKFISNWALRLISFFSRTGRDSSYVCTCTCRQWGQSALGTLFPPQHTFSAALPCLLAAELRFPQLFMSHLLRQVLCQMCVK